MNPGSPTEVACRSGRQRGFTLLEVLIAFVLLSLTLGVILQIFSGGLRGVAAAGHYTEAVIIAESKLALLGGELPLEEGEQDGEEGAYSWHMRIEPYQETAELSKAANSPYRLYMVTLRLQWRDGIREPELEFITYRLAGQDDS